MLDNQDNAGPDDNRPSLVDLLDDDKTVETEETTSETEAETQAQSEEVETAETESESEDSEAEELVYELDGEDYTIEQLREFKQGGLRQQDYTKKTTELADNRKAFEARQAQFDQTIQDFQLVAGEINKLLVPELNGVDLDELAQDDPNEFTRLKHLQETRGKKFDEVLNKAQEVRNQIIADQNQKLHSSLGWDDSSKKDSDLKLLNDFATKKGFTKDDFAQLTSAKVLETLIDAAKSEKLKATVKDKKLKPAAPKTVKPSQRKAKVNARPKLKNLLYGD